MSSFASRYSRSIRLLSAYLLFLGINFNYLQRLELIPALLPDRPSKLLSILFLLTVPSVFMGIKKILPRKSFFNYFILWSFVLTIISFLSAKFLDISTPFSVEARLIEQLTGFICAVCIGHYSFIAFIRFPFLLKRILLYSLYLVFVGILIQFLFGGFDTVVSSRLFGMSGEPKGLALFMVPFVFALFLGQSFNKPFTLIILSISLLSMLFTQSATAFWALLLLAIIATLISVHTIHKKLLYLWLLISSLILVIINNSKFYDGIFVRIFNYLEGVKVLGIQETFNFPFIGNIVVEANELPLLLHFENFPLFIFTGLGLGQESTWCIGYIEQLGGIGFLGRDYVGYISPNSALLANIGTYGLIFLVLVFAISIHHFTFIYKKIHDPDRLFALNVVSANLVTSLFVFQTSFPMVAAFTFICLLYSYLRNASDQNNLPLDLLPFGQGGM